MNNIPDLTGYIFERNGYWKIIDAPQASYYNSRVSHYPCVKCTKHGKEFSRRNSFAVDMIVKLYQAGSMVKCGLTEDVKVSTAGQASGARKRRISHLQGEINSMIVELNKLLMKENAGKQYTVSSLDIPKV